MMIQKKLLSVAAAATVALALPCAALAQNSGNSAAAGNANEKTNGNLPSQRFAVTNPVGQGAILTISSAGVREVQQGLNRLGYSAGPITGSWNRRTQQSMREFQSAHGLEPTGNLDISSIDALGLWQRILGNPTGNGHGTRTAQATGSPAPRAQEGSNGNGNMGNMGNGNMGNGNMGNGNAPRPNLSNGGNNGGNNNNQ